MADIEEVWITCGDRGVVLAGDLDDHAVGERDGAPGPVVAAGAQQPCSDSNRGIERFWVGQAEGGEIRSPG